MKTTFYKIECLTNLHVGSGDVNYNIIDNEVEKDPVTKVPIIHASGIKGALRDVTEKNNKDLANKIFGYPGTKDAGGPGTHKFFDAHLIARPMRVAGSTSLSSIPVVTVASVNQFLSTAEAFGCNTYGIKAIDALDFGDNIFLTNAAENLSVEGEKTGKLTEAAANQFLALKNILGDVFAVASSFDSFDLPVMARNHLENGISKNLWYEEVVPHGSIFTFAIMAPVDDDSFEIPEIVQFGGHSSIGCGFTRVTKL